jgi:hypothetical protein
MVITQWFDSVTGLPVTDLSSTNKLVTDWIPVGVGRKYSSTLVWPATGSPVGAVGVEGTNDYAARTSDATARTVVGDAVNLDTQFVPAPVQPNATAGRMVLSDNSDCVFIRHTYLRTSGGIDSSMVINFGL